MRRFSRLALAAAAALCAAVALPVRADVVTDAEPNDTRATATIIANSAFTTPQPGTTFTFGPTATVEGSLENTGELDKDFFRFSGVAGQKFIFDIDSENVTSPVFDLYLSLFDADGTLLAFNDDAPLDAGSIETFGVVRDPFIGVFTLPTTGDYYVVVTTRGNEPGASFSLDAVFTDLFRPDSENGGTAVSGAPIGDDSFFPGETNDEDSQGNYRLFISADAVGAAAPVPEPGAWATGAIFAGMTVLGVLRGRRRRRSSSRRA